MNRISALMASMGSRKLLVPFLTVGYPNLQISHELAYAAIEAGADMLELGMPFSDPLADGPQVQLSSQVALQNGVNMKDVLKTAEAIRKRANIPLILMGYFNPVLAYGVGSFTSAARASGVDGLIIPDLPVEEANGYLGDMRANDLASIFLVAPTTTRERTRVIDKSCSAFVYAVTVTGVTGARSSFDSSTDNYLRRLKQQLTKPFVAGFGVSSPESARRLASHADGVVIGSKLISLVQGVRSDKEAVRQVGAFLAGIRQTLNKL